MHNFQKSPKFPVGILYNFADTGGTMLQIFTNRWLWDALNCAPRFFAIFVWTARLEFGNFLNSAPRKRHLWAKIMPFRQSFQFVDCNEFYEYRQLLTSEQRWDFGKEDNGESGTMELTIVSTTNKLRRYNCFIRFWFLFSKVYITLMGFSFIGVWVYSNLLKMFNFLLDHFVD